MKLNALIAEFIGTFALLFAGVGSAMACMTGAAAGEKAGVPALLIVALAHGLAIAVCGSALGHVSGGHFNPAVSLAMVVGKQLSFVSMIGYWIAQFAGAVVAVFIVKMTTLGDSFESANGAVPQVSAIIDPVHGFLLEAIGTFFLVLVIFGTAVDKRAPKAGAWFIGLTITTMILAFGPMTGTGINPARWFGPALVRAFFDNAWVYTVGPFVGAVVAALLYCKVLAPEGVSDAAA